MKNEGQVAEADLETIEEEAIKNKNTILRIRIAFLTDSVFYLTNRTNIFSGAVPSKFILPSENVTDLA